MTTTESGSRFGNAMRTLFAKQQKPQTLPTNEEAQAGLGSMVYTMSDFGRYNPDDLIGRKGNGVYKKMMNDEQLKAVVKFKRDAITSRDYTFVLDHEQYGLSAEEAKRRIDLFDHIINKMEGSWIDRLNGIMSATQYGFSITEKIFQQIEWDNVTWWGLKALKLRPFDTFTFKSDDYGNIEGLLQKIGGKVKELDYNKFIHMVVNPDVDEHYGQSDIREAYRAWFSKDVIIKFRNMWLERHMGGFRWATSTDRDILPGTPEYVAMQSILSNINTATGIMLPRNVELHGDYPANNAAFKEAIADYNTDMARAVLVPNLLGVSPQGEHGSLAQADTQLEAFLWTLEADALRLEEVLNEQLFRQLGEINFGDDAWPRYKAKPISSSKIMKLVTTWKDLVAAGAVRRTKSDEAHIREMLEFPEADEDEADGDVGDTDEQQLPSDQQAPSDQQQPPVEPNEQQPAGPQQPDSAMSTGGETVMPKGTVTVTAFTQATKRVDFKVIDRKSTDLVEHYTSQVGDVMGMIVEGSIENAMEGGGLEDNVSANISALKVPGKLKTKLNRLLVKALKDAWRIGTTHAAVEVDKAKKEAFSRNLDAERLDMIADDYFITQAFTMTGNFTDDALQIMGQEILNGAKYGRSWAEVTDAIYQAMATKGMISVEQARDALGEALGVAVPDARLATAIRTATFDAINAARYGYFTDPALGGFVEGFEYSAILDDRTTAICRHLDEDQAGYHSTAWYDEHPEYRPPNHFNCRSVLVPVTQVDTAGNGFEEGPEPTLQPQEGFK